jgi:hypothetical protein
MKKALAATFMALFFMFLLACSSMKPGSSGPSKGLFETFYVGDDGMQYFIKPLVFEDNSNRNKLEMDLLFRYKNEIKDSATLNLSLIGEIFIKEVDSLVLSNNKLKTVTNEVSLMFNEKGKEGFHSRCNTKVPFGEVVQLFENSDWKITVYGQNEQTITYLATKRTSKSIEGLNADVFVLIR